MQTTTPLSKKSIVIIKLRAETKGIRDEIVKRLERIEGAASVSKTSIANSGPKTYSVEHTFTNINVNLLECMQLMLVLRDIEEEISRVEKLEELE